ncbi:hypothetical protein JK386_00850 [Nocardioides sp. zg-536]|uniref:Uncharacterized protein n=1 Tax=Nocardioides faecalis TaxID=2803858 RepID=A0A938XYC9_9ACTN|nr:hypothetical protein [Nocardioides faecalis]MBM9458446.1 hypothetical protein [Nocardioides faecalis]QVI58461.1 hypothetical protein KG111_15940 [Nocardioides faecalis]
MELSWEQVWELRRRWDETTEARRRWLSTQSGIELEDSEECAAALWGWFLEWADEPTGLDACPPPVWWAPPATDTLAYARQYGIEAFTAYLELVCWQRHPELVPAVTPRPARLGRGTTFHDVGLGFTDAPEYGVAWPAALVNDDSMRIVALPSGDLRRDRRGVRAYSAVSRWVATNREEREKVRTGPTMHIERITDPVLVEHGGFTWDIGFDEDVSHERSDLVAGYARALNDLDGVREVDHYDRGAIRVAGSVTKRSLQAWSKKWLKDNSTP